MGIIDYFKMAQGHYVLASLERDETYHNSDAYAVYYTESPKLLPQESEYFTRVYTNLEDALDDFREQELLYELYEEEQEEEEQRTAKWKCVLPTSRTPIKVPVR